MYCYQDKLFQEVDEAPSSAFKLRYRTQEDRGWTKAPRENSFVLLLYSVVILYTPCDDDRYRNINIRSIWGAIFNAPLRGS